jgi:hypothetical protein
LHTQKQHSVRSCTYSAVCSSEQGSSAGEDIQCSCEGIQSVYFSKAATDTVTFESSVVPCECFGVPFEIARNMMLSLVSEPLSRANGFLNTLCRFSDPVRSHPGTIFTDI